MDSDDHHLVTLGRIEAKVDLLLEREDKRDHRVTSIEKQLWYGKGALALAAAALLTKFRTILGV
jgi:hypothetical protein